MSIFGSSYPKISGSLGEVLLEESKINYNFFGTDVIEHTSVLTGHKSYAYTNNQSAFQVDILLCNYDDYSTSSSLAKFNDIYKYNNQYFNFYPHSDWSASIDINDEPIEYFMTEFQPYYLGNDERYDGILITISPRSNSKLKPVDTTLGWGLTPYGINYGY